MLVEPRRQVPLHPEPRPWRFVRHDNHVVHVDRHVPIAGPRSFSRAIGAANPSPPLVGGLGAIARPRVPSSRSRRPVAMWIAHSTTSSSSSSSLAWTRSKYASNSDSELPDATVREQRQNAPSSMRSSSTPSAVPPTWTYLGRRGKQGQGSQGCIPPEYSRGDRDRSAPRDDLHTTRPTVASTTTVVRRPSAAWGRYTNWTGDVGRARRVTRIVPALGGWGLPDHAREGMVERREVGQRELELGEHVADGHVLEQQVGKIGREEANAPPASGGAVGPENGVELFRLLDGESEDVGEHALVDGTGLETGDDAVVVVDRVRIDGGGPREEHELVRVLVCAWV
ncbi:hypothetical protein LXA43DRAFT_104402 [Ganoderma leucocontextum]|nr:hypothetical protein LXA43DRAFT_104402 [Ganoderma leucocontextum]